METPSEWAKRFNRQKMDEAAGVPHEEVAAVTSPVPVAEFPTEPFQCPACGQLLAPTCRVCVACKHAIDPAELTRLQSVALPEAPTAVAGPKPQPVRFSWPLFFVVFGVSCFLVIILQGLWKDQQQVLLIMGGIQTLAGVWVFFDAMRQRVPKPLRWSLGSMLLPLVIFPWYLARRRVPQSPVPFLEGGRAIRLVLFALLLFLLANLIFYLVQGSSPNLAPTPPSKEHKSGGSQVRINPLPGWKNSSWRRKPGGNSHSLTVGGSVQAESSAPSDAWHT
jgi:hypothetical protein